MSRERLAVPGEAILVVPPLSADASTKLFLQRAAAVGAELETEEERIERVCRTLDGLPLAIELAAAQLSTLGFEDVEARLTTPLQTLRGGARTAHARYQSLDASIAWSYDLLTEPQRQTFRRLGFFVGSFTSATAKTACAQTEGQDDVVESFRELVAKSLVTISLSGGTARYRLMEPLRAFAAARLDESGERDAVGRRLLDHYAARIRRRDIDTDPQTVEHIEREHDAIRSVLSWAFERDTSGKALRLCTELRLFWQIRGRWSEGCRWIEIALLGPAPTEDARAQALVGLASLYDVQGELHASGQAAAAALEHAERHGDPKTVSGALQVSGLSAARQGRPLEAEKIFERALDYSLDDPARAAPLLSNLGLMAKARGDFAAAGERFERALELARAARQRSVEAVVLHNLAVLARATGDKVKARQLYMSGLELAIDEAHRVTALMDLASYDMADGDLRHVPARLADAQSACDRLGDKFAAAQILLHIGDVRTALGEADEALRIYEEAGRAAAVIGSIEKEAFAAVGCARVEALYLRRLDEARRHCEQGRSIFESAGYATGHGKALSALGLIDALEGNTDSARRTCKEAIAIFEEAGARGDAASARSTLALTEALAGNVEEAESLAADAAETMSELGETNALPEHFETIAWCRASTQDARTAAVLLGAAARLREDRAIARPPADQARIDETVDACRTLLDDYDAAFEEGLSLTIGDVMTDVRERNSGRARERALPHKAGYGT